MTNVNYLIVFDFYICITILFHSLIWPAGAVLGAGGSFLMMFDIIKKEILSTIDSDDISNICFRVESEYTAEKIEELKFYLTRQSMSVSLNTDQKNKIRLFIDFL